LNSIKINITLPKASELKSDLNALLTQIQSKTSLNLDVDITSFKTSIGEVSQMLGKLKTQMSSLSGIETLVNTNVVNQSTKAIQEQNNAIKEQQKLLDERVLKTSNTKMVSGNGEDIVLKDLEQIRDEYGNIIEVVNNYNSKTGEITSTIVKTTNEIEKQRIANERLLQSTEKTKDILQSKLNQSLSNKNFTLIDDSVFTRLQSKIDSINTNTPEKEVRELQLALNNLNSSDSQIVRLQNAISKYEVKIDGLKGKYKNLVPQNELNDAINKINQLKGVLSEVQNNDNFYTNKGISNVLNQASTSMNSLSNATKIASEQQRLYNKEVVSFSGAFKDVATKVGLFSVVYTAINSVQSAFREGFQSVVEMNDALTDLAKVVDLNKQQLLSMRDSAVAMGEALGRSAIDVAKAQAEFGRQYKDIAQINEMTRVSILGANVMDGTNADEVAKGLTTIISSLKLEAKDAIGIIDSLNEVQNNYRISASSMLSALSEVGSTAKVAGADIYQLQGYITAMAVATGKSGDEIGNSLRSITSRIYKIGAEGIEAEGKPEKMLQSMGVAVRDLNGEFRPLNQILSDLSVKWKDMNDTQRIGTAQTVAGVHRYNDFISLMNNFDMAIKSSETAMNSLNSATIENEIYLESITGKMESLKATTEGFWMDFISSDMIKGGVDALQSLIKALNGLQNTFGSLGLSVGILSSGFLTFTNNPLKQFAEDIVKHKTTLGGLSDILNQVKLKVQETGSSMNIAQKSSLALRTGFDLVGKTAIATQIKVMALQTVLSLGLSAGIMLVISGISKLVTALNTSGKSMDDVKMQSDTLANSLDNIAKERNLSNQYETISNQLKDANLEENKRNELKKELDSIMKDLVASEQGYYGILNDENLTLDQQLQKMEQIRQAKLFDEAKELDDDMLSQNDIEDKVSKLNGYIQTYRDLQEAINSGNSQKLIDLIGVSDIDEAKAILGDTKNRINELDGEIIKYNSSVKLMNDSNYETTRSLIALDNNTDSFVTSLNESTDALDKNTKAKQENSNVDGIGFGQNLEEVTKSYGKSIEELEKLYSMQQKINESQSITGDLVMQLADKYPELGANINDVAYVQEFLNNKINEQQEISRKAYQTMIENDAVYFNTKIKNTAEYENYIVEVLNHIKDANIDYYNKNIDGMQNELKNAQTLAQARAILEQNLVNSLAGLWSDYYKTLSSQWYTDRPVYQYAAGKGTALYDETNKILDRQNEIAIKAKELADRFSNFSSSAFVPYVSGDFSSLNGADKSSSKSAKKEIDDMGKLSDRYLEVKNSLKQLDNELDRNKILMENTSDEEKLKYLEKELELIKKQEMAYKNKNKEQEKELSELKNSLVANGFNADGSGRITNANSRLDALTNWANSLSGDAKENAQKNVKAIAESLERYNDLLLNQIPEVSNTILDLKNTTIDTQKEIVELIKKQKDTYIENIEKETDALKKAIQKRKDLRNKEWDEDDYRDELKKRQDSLVDLESQLQDAMRMADGELIANIKKQIESAQQDINSFIRDNERDKANERYDEELEKIDEDSQKKIDEINSKLTDEEILKIVQNGVRDLSSVLDNIGGASKNVVTTFDIIDTNISNMKTNLSDILKDLQSINTIDLNLNAKVSGNISNNNSKPVEIQFVNTYNITPKNGEEITMSDVERVVKKGQDETIKRISELV